MRRMSAPLHASANPHALAARRPFLGALLCFAIVGGTSTLLPSTGVLAATPASAGSELRIGTTQEFENLNPLISSMSATQYILGAVNRSAPVVLDENNKWKPQAAVRIPSIENGDAKLVDEGGKKKLKVTWEIRKEARWGDGTPITATDYELAWKVGRGEKTSVPNREPFTNVEAFEIDKANPKRFTLTYTEPKYTFFRAMWSALPAHVEAAAFKAHGDQVEGYDRNNGYVKDASNPALYSGPYRVAALKLGSHVELVPNENWWGPKPSLGKIVVRVIPNSATLESNLLSGEIHVVNSVGMSLDQALQFEKRVQAEKLPYKVIYVNGQTFEHVDLDLDNPLLADVRVRKALLHAIDRDALVKALFAGKQQVAHHFIHPTDPWYTDDAATVTKHEYSPRKARRLLAEAGFKAGASGVLEKDGKALRLPLMTTSGNKMRENVQVFIKDQLKQVGVEAEIRNEPAKVFFGETTSKRRYGGMALYAWVSSPELTPRQTYHSRSIPTEANGWAGTNQMGWKNAKVDAAIDALEQDFSLERRKKQAAVVLREYTNDVPVLPLFYRANVTIAPATLAGMTPTPTTFYETFHVERWKFEQGALSKR